MLGFVAGCYAVQIQSDDCHMTSHEQRVAGATRTAKKKLTRVAESATVPYGTVAGLAMYHVDLVESLAPACRPSGRLAC